MAVTACVPALSTAVVLTWALPLLIRGRTPLLDGLGALIWAAGLISAVRLVAGGSGPPGLLFGALLASAVAAVLTRRFGPSEPLLPASRPYGDASLEHRGSGAVV